jgi:hypothetical protein
MIYAVLRRTLKEGVSFEEFREAWAPPPGGDTVDFVVTHARSIADPREILSVGRLDMGAEEFMEFAASERFAAVNAGRHERIAPLVEETDSGFLGAYEVIEGDAISL